MQVYELLSTGSCMLTLCLQEHVRGLSCNTCAASSFYLHAAHDTGCLGCVCMGITADCSATSWRVKTLSLPLVQSEPATTDFRLVSRAGDALGAQVTIGQFEGLPALEARLEDGEEAYWSVPELLSGRS